MARQRSQSAPTQPTGIHPSSIKGMIRNIRKPRYTGYSGQTGHRERAKHYRTAREIEKVTKTRLIRSQ